MKHATRICASVALLATAIWSASASAQQGDGLYGRFRGDVAWAVGAGVQADPSGQKKPSGTVDVRARYLDTAGLVLGWAGWPGGDAGGAGHFIVATEVRPLFPALFLMNLYSGSRFVDLTLQSLSFEVGVAADLTGFSLLVGSGLELPLVWSEEGFPQTWLRVFARYRHTHEADWQAAAATLRGGSVGVSLHLGGRIQTGLSGWAPPSHELR